MSNEDCEPSTSSLEANQSNSNHTESVNDDSDDSEGMYSDAVESMDEQTPENSSDIAEDEGSGDVESMDEQTPENSSDMAEDEGSGDVESMDEQTPENLSATAENNGSCDVSAPDSSDFGWEMDDGDMAIAFSPDYILYRDIYCTDPKVTFSANCIKVSGSTAYGNKQIFSIEMAIDDVVEIRSQWCGQFEMAQVILSIIVRDSMEDDANGSTDIETLEFIVVDSYWYKKTEAILSLDVRYKAMWNFMHNTERNVDQEDLIGKRPMLLPRKYFPIFGENFEDVIYPQGDIDAVSISMRDVDLLKPDTFINDTIIDFYIKYLKNKILPDERHRFHFFNCFFFRKLADMDKDPSSAFEGRAAFLRVRKWTRKVNLFDKDFIFIPVNYNYHWSLIVICHAGEIANIRDEDIKKSPRVPCILHMDSLRGSHANLKDLFQSYLWEEWKERQKSTVEDTSSKFHNLSFVSLELPQQQNFYDCGLFLLHYVECFLEDAPANFSPSMITKYSKFLTDRWFPTAEPSIKRGVIHRLIYDLLNKCSQSPSGNSERWCPSNNARAHNDNENACELFAMGSSSSKDGHVHLLHSDGGQGIETDLLQASSFKGSQCANSGLVLRDLFDPISSASLLLDEENQAFGRTTSFNEFRNGLPSIEEEVEPDLHLVHTTLTESEFQHLDVVAPETSGFQHAPKDFRSEAACIQTSFEGKYDGIDLTPGYSTCDSEYISKVEIAENFPVEQTCLDDKIDPMIPVSPENIYVLETHGSTPPCDETTEDTGSQRPVQMLDHIDNADPPICVKNLSEFSNQKDDDNNMGENDEILCYTRRAAKKMRLTCPSEVGREFSSTTLSNDLHL